MLLHLCLEKRFIVYMFKMKFFLDENIPISTTDIFIKLNFEVEHCKNSKLRGSIDNKIAEHAKKQKAILVTKDLEFGSLLIYPKNSHYGLIILRLPNNFTAEKIYLVLEKFLRNIRVEDLINSITVLEIGRYRIRKLK